MMTFNLLSVQNIAVNLRKEKRQDFYSCAYLSIAFRIIKPHGLSTEIIEFSQDIFLQIY